MLIDLSDSSIVAFQGSLTPCDTAYTAPTDDAIWVGTPGGLALAVRTGDTAPGTTAQTFTGFFTTFVNDSGDLAINGSIGDFDEGVWMRSAGNLNLLAKSDETAPGAAGRLFTSVHPIGFNELGVATVWGNTGGNFDRLPGIWKGTPGAFESVVNSGDLAPGAAGQYFDQIDFPTSSNSDYTAFWATTTNPDPGLAEGIWKAGPSGIDLVALLGNVAPAADGRVFRAFNGWGLTPNPTVQDEWISGERFDALVVNRAGDVAFTGYIDPLDPVDMYSDAGIWIRNAAGSTSPVALTDDIAPGTAAEPFLYFNHINLNASGQVAFDASLDIADPATDHGIWVGLPGSLNLVVREGDPAPGTAGETFDSLLMGPTLNDSGEIAFFAKLRESGTYGLWAAASDGNLSLIARMGDMLEVKSGDFRTIELIGPIDGGLGGYSWLNRFNGAGQLAFFAYFTDGTSAILLGSPASTLPNQPPLAIAGPDQAIAENNTTVLDGTASNDPDGTILFFSWSLNGVEIGTEPKVTVGPLAVGAHTITLTVTDRSGASASDDMILTVFANLPPVANAGPDQTVDYTQSVTFDGTGSSDPEGEALTYVWNIGCSNGAAAATDTDASGGPAAGMGSCPEIATGPNPTVGSFVVGTSVIVLTVTDIHGAIATDEMILTVTNDPPVANAGPDQTIQTLETTILDGNGSSDAENDIMSYVWSIDGVQIATGASPVVGPFYTGVYTVTLTVRDGRNVTATDTVVLTVLNRAPVANAGLDKTVNHTQTVLITGSGSSDPEGGPLTLVWSVGGVQIATGYNSIVGSFAVGVHTVTLTVTDDRGATATDSMTLTVTNAPPLANAGMDQTANHAQTVTLAGSGSDPEGGVLTYAWSVGGVQIATGANPVVGPFEVGVHTVTLTVTDDHGATATDSMAVTVVNEAPVANAGPDQTVSLKKGKTKTATATLDGSASSDPEGGALSYLWTLDGQTAGTGVVLQVELPAGTHTLTLAVTDDHGAMASDTVVVTAAKGGGA